MSAADICVGKMPADPAHFATLSADNYVGGRHKRRLQTCRQSCRPTSRPQTNGSAEPGEAMTCSKSQFQFKGDARAQSRRRTKPAARFPHLPSILLGSSIARSAAILARRSLTGGKPWPGGQEGEAV